MTDALLLREQDRQEIVRLLSRHLPDVAAWAYGSRVNGGAHEGSDLDIVLRSPDLSPIPLEELRAFVQAARDSNIPILVEARDWARLPESFQQEIMKNYVVLREIVSEWKECKLNELGVLARGKSKHRPRYDFHLYGGKYPFIQTGEIKAARKYIREFEKTYSEAGLQQSKLWKKGTLCITIAANIAEIGILSFDACFPDSVIGFLPDKNKSDLDFIYYSLIFFQKELKHLGEGSVQDNINLGTFDELTFPIPPLHEQKVIASVLSSLDDKIDLLHRQNKTLEAMAEALFRQWFVEEAGEDWEEIPLSKIANFLNGLACQKYKPLNCIDRLPVLKIKELSNGITNSSDWVTNTIKKEYIVNNGDVIFSWSASLMVKIWHGEPCVINQHLFKVTSKEFPKWFYYMWCKHHLDEFISISSSHATTMGHIKRCDLDNALVLVPEKQELEIMSSIMTPLIDKLITNQKQIRTIEQLRDTLLPKLMSGEVRVAYAHEHIE